MSKTDVYSWRVTPELKNALEAAARAERASVAALLERIVAAWLEEKKAETNDEQAQIEVREKAAKYVGSIKGGDPMRAQESSQRVKSILKDKEKRARLQCCNYSDYH